ncbi:hypothetical protein ACQ4PT_010309 [Festuca glaucescens]
MEVAFSALVGELAQRSISFFIVRLSKPEEPSMPTEETLWRKLLRVHVVVEEAEGRQITSRSMLEQLKLLREGMHRGYFVLDSFKYRSCQEPESSKEDNDGDIGCPRMRRQPYDTYMLLERCMFGRHVEMEHIINFLLQMGTGDLEVLPIVGPAKAGKSTLIEHACNDERVRRPSPESYSSPKMISRMTTGAP